MSTTSNISIFAGKRFLLRFLIRSAATCSNALKLRPDSKCSCCRLHQRLLIEERANGSTPLKPNSHIIDSFSAQTGMFPSFESLFHGFLMRFMSDGTCATATSFCSTITNGFTLSPPGWRVLDADFGLILDYEDGKHLIDSGAFSVACAPSRKRMGRPLLAAALVAAPALQKRLPSSLPVEFVPGFYCPPLDRDRPHSEDRASCASSIRVLSTKREESISFSRLLIFCRQMAGSLDVTGAGDLHEQVRERAGRSGNQIIFMQPSRRIGTRGLSPSATWA